MFTEILKVIPKLDNADMAKMERTLSSRFKRVAVGFGKGLKLAMIGSFAAGLMQKFLAPLNEVREAIERTLKSADEVVTNANEFGTSTEKLLKLRSLAALSGVGPEQLDILLSKFKGAVSAVTLNPDDQASSAVKQFTGRKDLSDAFFEFIQSLQKASPENRNLAQQQIFGEKQVLKMAEFLQADFGQQMRDLSKVRFDLVAKSAEKLAKLEEIDARNRTINNLNDLIAKGQTITPGMIQEKSRSEQFNLSRENDKIARFSQMSLNDRKMTEISDNVEKLVGHIMTELPGITTALNKGVELMKIAVDGWKMIFDLVKSSSWVKKGIKLFGGD